MEFTKNNSNNVSWSELFNRINVKHEDRKSARKALRDGIAKFDSKEIQILQSSNFFQNWFNANKAAMHNSCSTQTVQYFESIILKNEKK